jgi:hypothetical protein
MLDLYFLLVSVREKILIPFKELNTATGLIEMS